jgi:carbamoyl-phosphate synthase small subunit
MQQGILLLSDGTIYTGLVAGANTVKYGELCLFTGMTGYQEAFTDPSYTDQIIVMSNAHIGNYGIKYTESESSKIRISGMVCRNYSTYNSRINTETLDVYLKNSDCPVIHNIDTRALITHLRQYGNMNAAICTMDVDLEEIKNTLKNQNVMAGNNIAAKFKHRPFRSVSKQLKNKYHIGVLDFGCKDNIIQELTTRQAECNIYTVNNFPQHFEEDAYLISNGPGDPAVMSDAIELIKKIVKTGKPVFGICLGHQLLALSQGCKTYKMQTGHRGTNHAVLNIKTGQAEVTSQNHGFAVSKEELPSNIEITHLNLNDDTIEGLRIKNTNCFSVQHHPEACAGPHDSNYLFDDFFNLISKNQ